MRLKHPSLPPRGRLPRRVAAFPAGQRPASPSPGGRLSRQAGWCWGLREARASSTPLPPAPAWPSLAFVLDFHRNIFFEIQRSCFPFSLRPPCAALWSSGRCSLQAARRTPRAQAPQTLPHSAAACDPSVERQRGAGWGAGPSVVGELEQGVGRRDGQGGRGAQAGCREVGRGSGSSDRGAGGQGAQEGCREVGQGVGELRQGCREVGQGVGELRQGCREAGQSPGCRSAQGPV